MNKHGHTLAQKLVKDALDRFTAPSREEREGDAQLIVLGAILEEVSNGSGRNGFGGVTIIIGRKAIAGLVTLLGGAGAGLWVVFQGAL